MMPLVGNWTGTLSNVGIQTAADADGGDGWGAFIATSSINPANWTRSYSRSAYIDPLPPRSNLAVLPNATVTRLIFKNSTQGNLSAVAVEYASARGAPTSTVNVTKEVILAGGAIGSPQVLMLSGVGPTDVLQAAGIAVQVELPGVGQHLQDHIVSIVLGLGILGVFLTSWLGAFRQPKLSGKPQSKQLHPFMLRTLQCL